jgi:hypothetical protein
MSRAAKARSSAGARGVIWLGCAAHLALLGIGPHAIGAVARQDARALVLENPELVWLLLAVSAAALLGLAALGSAVARRRGGRSLVLLLPASIALAIGYVGVRALGSSAAAAVVALAAWDFSLVLSATAFVLAVRRGGSHKASALAAPLALGLAAAASLSVGRGLGSGSMTVLPAAVLGVVAVALLAARRAAAGKVRDFRSELRASGDLSSSVVLVFAAVALAALAAGIAELGRAGASPYAARAALADGWSLSLSVPVAAIAGFASRPALVGLSLRARGLEVALVTVLAVTATLLLRGEYVAASNHVHLAASQHAPAMISRKPLAAPRTQASTPAADNAAATGPATGARDEALADSTFAADGVEVVVTRFEGMLLSDVKSGFSRRMGWFAECAAAHATGDATLSLQVTVDANGGVRHVRPLSGVAPRKDKLWDCTLSALYRLGFPRPHADRTVLDVSVRYGQSRLPPTP